MSSIAASPQSFLIAGNGGSRDRLQRAPRSTHRTDTAASSSNKALLSGLFFSLLVVALSAGSWFSLKDDLLNSAMQRTALQQHAYEDKVAALRIQADLATSRKMAEKRAEQARHEKLMVRQAAFQRLKSHFAPKPVILASTTQTTAASKPVIKPTAPNGLRLSTLAPMGFAPKTTPQPVATDLASLIFVETSLAENELAQLAELDEMRKQARRKARKLSGILKRQGIRFPQDTAIGGPLIEITGPDRFTDTVDALDASLETLDKVRRMARHVPHGSPVPGKKISSRYGKRTDPFTARRAVHGGLDFRARKGAKVFATASGKVIRAGRNGGYGKMVEIKHGSGITTRYAHLSRIRVKVGQKVKRGTRIGNVGSTGRSTGPHLHYEVRRKGRTMDPLLYVKLEKRFKPYL